MSTNRYPEDTPKGYEEDDGTMPANVAQLEEAVIGRRIVSAVEEYTSWKGEYYDKSGTALVLTLDDGTRVVVADTSNCCAYTALEEFFLDPASVNHAILGVGTTEGYTTWHIYADFGDIMRLKVGWSCGNPFYYGYGFEIAVQPEVPRAN